MFCDELGSTLLLKILYEVKDRCFSTKIHFAVLPVLAIFNKRTSEPIWQVKQYKRRYVKQIIIPGRTLFLRKISRIVLDE